MNGFEGRIWLYGPQETNVTPQSPKERRVVCENCGEVIETEPIGGPLDTEPELGDADHLVESSDCPLLLLMSRYDCPVCKRDLSWSYAQGGLRWCAHCAWWVVPGGTR